MQRILAFTILSAFTLSACKEAKPQQDYTTSPHAEPQQADIGDRLVMPTIGEPPSLLPMLAADTGAAEIGGNIYQALLTYDKNLNLIINLAEKYEITNNGKTITFTLKPNLKFADGSALTSADVMATYQQYINPTTKTPYAADYQLVEKAEAPDAYTFRVTYPEAFVPALSSWAGLLVLPKKIIDKSRDDFNNTELKTKPLGSGSYTLTDWVRGQSILITRNASSTEPPFIAQLQYRLMPDTNTQFMALKRGELDYAGLSPLAFSRQTDADWFKQRFNKYSYLGNSYTYLGFNLSNPLFKDKRVRQALSYAVDRKGIVRAVLFGQGRPMAGIFKPGTWPNNANLQPYPFNPQKAKQLLAEAGWQDTDGDGWLDKDGKPFRFTIATNQGNDVRIRTATILQSLFADVGVDVKIRVQEWSSFLTNTLQPRAFDAILMGWALGAEPDPYDIWHSSKTKPGEFNMIGYNNPQVDELMDKARREFDQTKRQKLLWDMQEILHEEQPYLWLYAPNALIALHKRVQNIHPAPAGLSHNQPFWFVPQNWHLRPTLQQ